MISASSLPNRCVAIRLDRAARALVAAMQPWSRRNASSCPVSASSSSRIFISPQYGRFSIGRSRNRREHSAVIAAVRRSATRPLQATGDLSFEARAEPGTRRMPVDVLGARQVFDREPERVDDDALL